MASSCCPQCGSDRWHSWHKPGGFGYVCTDCGWEEIETCYSQTAAVDGYLLLVIIVAVAIGVFVL